MMKKRLFTLFLLCCFSVGVNASVEDKTYFEAFLGAAAYSLDDDRSLERAISKEAGLEVPLNRRLSLETWLSDYAVEYRDGADEIEAKRYYGGALLHLKTINKKRPFIVLGYSHLASEKNSGNKSSESLFSFGVGLKRYYSNNVIVRGELIMMNSIDKELIDLGGRLSLGYAFKPAKPKPVYIPKPEPEPEPEPEPIVVAPVEKPKPLDTDHDGVTDDIDLCPDTNQAFKVDDTGCPIMLTEEVSITVDIKFASNSAELAEGSLPEIKKVADFMAQVDETVLTVTGHTDDRGSAKYNKRLSQQRADAVSLSLIDTFGIAQARVASIGYGEELPIADNTTKEGRAINRRVVVVVESSIEKEAVR